MQRNHGTVCRYLSARVFDLWCSVTTTPVNVTGISLANELPRILSAHPANRKAPGTWDNALNPGAKVWGVGVTLGEVLAIYSDLYLLMMLHMRPDLFRSFSVLCLRLIPTDIPVKIWYYAKAQSVLEGDMQRIFIAGANG